MDRLDAIQSYCSDETTMCGINLKNLLDRFDPDGRTIDLGWCWWKGDDDECDWMDDWFKDFPTDPEATKLICEIDRGVCSWKKFYEKIRDRYPGIRYAYVSQNYGSVDFTDCNFDIVIVLDSQSWDTPSGKLVYGYSITMGYGYMCQDAGEILTFQQSNGTTVVYGFRDQCIQDAMRIGLADLTFSKRSNLDTVISEYFTS